MSEIFLTLEKSVITPNEPVRGTVHIKLTRDLTNLRCVCAQIKGEEIYDQSDKEKQYLSSKTFLDFTYPVKEFSESEVLTEGEYDFPFLMNLPQGIPHSSRLSSESTHEIFSVSYTLTTSLLPQQAATELTCKLDLWVSGSSQSALPEGMPLWRECPEPQEVPFSFLCCSSGCLRLALQIPKVIVTGKPFDLQYSIFDLSKGLAVSAEFALWATLTPKSRLSTTPTSDRVKLFKTKQITSDLLNCDHLADSSVPHSTVKGEEPSAILSETVLREMKKAVHRPDHLLRIVLPEKYTFPSQVIAYGAKGLREVQYFVSFELTVGGKVVKVECPIELRHSSAIAVPVPSEVKQQQASVAPAIDWSASQVFEEAILPLPYYMEPVKTFRSIELTLPTPASSTGIAPESVTKKSSSPRFSFDGFADLIYYLKLVYDQVHFFFQWVNHSAANQEELAKASPHDYTLLFQTIRQSLDQFLIANHLRMVQSEMTLDHLLAAMNACRREVRVAVTGLLAAACPSAMVSADGGAAVAALQKLCSSLYDFLCLEEGFGQGQGQFSLSQSFYNSESKPKKAYDKLSAEEDIRIIGAESTEDGRAILHQETWSRSVSGDADDFEEKFDQIMNSSSMEVTRI